MNFHFISVIEPDKFISSLIPSYRLRLSYVFAAVKDLGFLVTGDLNVPKNIDIFYIGKLGEGIEKDKIRDILFSLKKINAKIFVDYTDDWLSRDQSFLKEFYENLIHLNAIFAVPVKGLSDKLKKNGIKTVYIPDGIDNISNVIPKVKNNEIRNLFWQGHSSNIYSLIRILGDQLSKYNFNLHIVTNHKSFDMIKNAKFNIIPKCKPYLYNWNVNVIKSVAEKCDFAILPIDKIWASSNRLVSNFRLGLPIVAETISSYSEYSNFYTNFQEPKISEMFDCPEKWHNSVRMAQAKIDSDFDKTYLIELWKNVFKNFIKKN